MARHMANDRHAALMASLVNPIAADQKTVAERKWTAPLKPAAEQKPCEGLFGDAANQTDLLDLLQE
jgi:hypothetical protein